MRSIPRPSMALLGLLMLLFGSVPAFSGVHLWRVKEVFSNADGTIQFIEIAVCCGSTGEIFIGTHPVTSNTHTFPFPSDLTGSTLNKHILLATSGFAALPGAPTPDHIIPNNFFSTTADTIAFDVYDTLVFSAGQLPTNGITSLNRDPDDPTHTIFPASNSPRNFAGQQGSVNASSGPPGVPDGTGGMTPMTVASLNADGSNLQVSFAVGSCTNAANHHILYGQRSGLPAALGGTFTLLGSTCSIGTTSPYSWLGVPQASDGSGLIWFLVVATNTSGIEGSWGKDKNGNERVGPGNNGASGTCAVLKDVTNTCGHVSP
jgi:hypothetical protein